MNYISLEFALFFCIGTVFYFVFSKRFQLIVLLMMNVMFYIYADTRYILYLGFTIISTFTVGYLLDSDNRIERVSSKNILLSGVIANVGLLIVVKYFSYVIRLFTDAFGPGKFTSFKLIVPLGISFYTLQAISYCVDVYKRKIKSEKNLLKYAVYLSYFPTIVQGPIVRYEDFELQIRETHKFDYLRVKEGFQLILYGLFKKMVIADRTAICVNDVWQNYSQYSKIWILVGVCMYSIQIYTDFSGCVDVCRGVSQVFGIEIMNNFKAPYFATSIKDFWHRWHISLSTWLRDYVYILCGGNRKGKVRKYINLLITFGVSGLWHGVGINYLIWGFLHGIYQILGELLLPVKKYLQNKFTINTNVYSYRLMQRIITFVLVSFSWIFFRSNGTREAMNILFAIKNNDWFMPFAAQSAVDFKDILVLLVGIILICCFSYLQQNYSIRTWINNQNLWFRWGIYFVAIFIIMIFGIYGSGYNTETFIYMQF